VHQTFYIDIDEEITSIVDRLRKSLAKEVIVVVPKRAILIQSIVNLKLLKKEADNLNKKLVIVTQDKLGKMLIEKTGIAVEQKLENIEGEEISEIRVAEAEKTKKDSGVSMLNKKDLQSRKRLDEIGSDEYYKAADMEIVMEQDEYIAEKKSTEERITNKELVVDMGDDLKRQKASFNKGISRKGFSAPMDMIRNVEIIEDASEKNEEIDGMPSYNSNEVPQKIFKQKKVSEFIEKGKKVEKKREKADVFFEHRSKINDGPDEYKSINVESGAWKYFIAFGIIFMLVLSGMAAYLYLPKVSIVVFPKNKIQSIDSQVEAKTTITEMDQEKGLIPAKIISVSDEATRIYDVTGTKNASNQKAHGIITIYNEFSASPQPLVATTRFETSDGKIFRLVSGVTVPGMEKVGLETKPGAIEAKVMADESGEQYNIEATSFTIPGFKSSGGDKYTKIYAKSSKPMVGGGQESQAVKVLSDEDIEVAKKKVMQELEPVVRQKLKESIGEEHIILDEAVNVDDSVYTLSNSSGDITDKFSITVKSTANAMVFRKDDIKKVLMLAIAKNGENNAKIAENSFSMEFGKSDIDFKDGNMIIRVHASGGIVPEINLEEIKIGILGKKEEDVKAFVNTYSNISNMEITYWPSFITGKIPSYESRVNISLDPALFLP